MIRLDREPQMKCSVLTGNPERKALAWQGTLNESLRLDREPQMKGSVWTGNPK